MPTPYEILGVPIGASDQEIKSAYKSLAGKIHPDKNPDDPDATYQFQQLHSAYMLLKDPERRKKYDETGDESVNQEPDREQQANILIGQLYYQIASSKDFTPANYLNDVIKAIQNNLRQCNHDSLRIMREIPRIENFIKNTKADEQIVFGFTQRLQQLEQQDNQLKDAKLVLTKALELLDLYEYTGVLADPSPSYTSTFSTNHFGQV